MSSSAVLPAPSERRDMSKAIPQINISTSSLPPLGQPITPTPIPTRLQSQTTTSFSASSSSDNFTPPPNSAGRPDLISRNSAHSARTNQTSSSSVQSIPEDGPLPSPGSLGRDRRSSVLGALSPRPGSGGSAIGGRRSGRLRDMSQHQQQQQAYEMSSVGRKEAGGVVITAAATKEDMALSKWRQWAVDQPTPTLLSADSSPVKSRKASSSNPSTLPNAPLPPSPRTSTSSRPSASYPGLSQSRSSWIPSIGSSAPSHPYPYPDPDPDTQAGSSRSGSGVSQRIFDTSDIFMTDSVRALQDVELAIDEDILARSVAQTRQSSRLLSNQPRLSQIENPFGDIAQRLGSRRIRPVVLELIISLGHYIYTLWSMSYPDTTCPWIIPSAENLSTPMFRGWQSRTITAVHQGQLDGNVLPPSPAQLLFWRAEVEYGLKDVDDAVGKWKKQGRVFSKAFSRGGYGEVEDDNVLGSIRPTTSGVSGQGGNIARLLNDLEEVIWGDAPPRPTDLAYTLPEEFDPYAEPDPGALITSPTPPSLADVLASSIPGRVGGTTPQTEGMEEILGMPDLIPPDMPHPLSSQSGEGDPTNHSVSGFWTERARQSISAQGQVSEGDTGGIGQLTLEQVGRKRHEEWLAIQK